MVLDVDSRDYKFHMEYERKLNIVRGDSGKGKSKLTEILGTNDIDVIVKSSLNYIVVNEGTLYQTMSNSENSLIIMDDLIINFIEFQNAYESTFHKGNYFLIITRMELTNYIETEKGGKYKKLIDTPFSSSDIFRFKAEGINHYLEPYYSLDTVCKKDEPIDAVVIEDSNAGYTFFSNLFNKYNTVSSNGKENIIKTILQEIEKNGYKHILAVFDVSAFGCLIDELFLRLKYVNCLVSFDIDYYSFEELLRSNLLNNLDLVKKEFKDISFYASKYLSWEKYFEDLICRATIEERFTHTHNTDDLKQCYYRSRLNSEYCNPFIFRKCSGFSEEENRFIYLLEGTK